MRALCLQSFQEEMIDSDDEGPVFLDLESAARGTKDEVRYLYASFKMATEENVLGTGCGGRCRSGESDRCQD